MRLRLEVEVDHSTFSQYFETSERFQTPSDYWLQKHLFLNSIPPGFLVACADQKHQRYYLNSVYFKSSIAGYSLFRKVIQDCLILYESHVKSKRFEFADCDASLKLFNRLEEYAFIASYCNAVEALVEVSCYYRFSSKCTFCSPSHLHLRFNAKTRTELQDWFLFGATD